MFILRRITGSGVEINQAVGDYTLVRRDRNSAEFNDCMEINKDYVKGDEERIFAFISFTSDTPKIQPLYDNQQNYIMTGNGETFSHVKP